MECAKVLSWVHGPTLVFEFTAAPRLPASRGQFVDQPDIQSHDGVIGGINNSEAQRVLLMLEGLPPGAAWECCEPSSNFTKATTQHSVVQFHKARFYLAIHIREISSKPAEKMPG